MKKLYELLSRRLGHATFLSIKSIRGPIEVQSSEKVIPPIIEYNEDGDYKIVGPREIVEGIKVHPYKSMSKDFPEERIADYKVYTLFKKLEFFPTLPTIVENEKQIPHPVAEAIYRDYVYLRPVPELEEKLKKMGYLAQTKFHPPILEQVVKNVREKENVNLDLFSVPKKQVGTFAYVSDAEGFAKPAKLFSFGFHKAVPCDRIAREISSLKNCEKFLNPQPLPFEFPDALKPFVTMVRVAIVGVEQSMLDSGDLYPSAIKKIACNLNRIKIVKNYKDESLVKPENLNLQYVPFRSGIEVVHKEEVSVNEEQVKPGAMRLIFPGGVKVAAQIQDLQAVDDKGEAIDIMLDFETFAKKGAVATLAMLSGKLWNQEPTLEDCKQVFLELKKETIYVGNTVYEGYVGYLPVMRPGQRYTELSKGSDEITVDLIAKALLNKEYVVRPRVEEEYQNLVEFRSALIQEKKLIRNG
jgi:hypothetical protein